MKAQNRINKKSEDQVKKEILEDWADVRRWIDDLQQGWIERNERSQTPKTAENTKRGRRSESSNK